MSVPKHIRVAAVSMIVGASLLASAARIAARDGLWTGGGDGITFEDIANWQLLPSVSGDGNVSGSMPPGHTSNTGSTQNTDRAIIHNSDAVNPLTVDVNIWRKLGGLHINGEAHWEPLGAPGPGSLVINPGVNSGTVILTGVTPDTPTSSNSNTGDGAGGPRGFEFSGLPYDGGGNNGNTNARIGLGVYSGHLIVNGGMVQRTINDEVVQVYAGLIRFGNADQVWHVAEGSTATFNVLVQLTNTQTNIWKRGDGEVILNGGGPFSGSTTAVADFNPNGTVDGGNAAQLYNWRIEEGTIVAASGTGTQWRANNTGVNILDGATVHLTGGTNWGLNATQTGPENGFKHTQIAGHGVNGLGAIRVSNGDSLFQSGTNSASGGNPNSFRLASASTGIGVDTGATLTITDDIGGSGGLTKLGGGMLILEAKNHYAGNTTVAAGTLLINAQRSAVVKNIALVAAYAATTNTTTITVDNTTGLSIGQMANGTWTLGSFNASTNNTFVQGDASALTGTITFDGIQGALASAVVTVQSGATLGGTGMIRNTHVDVAAGGFIAPGASIGTFDVGSADIDGTLKIEFGGNAIDKLVVVGALDLTNATVDFSSLGSLANGEYIFATYDSLVSGNSFANVLNLPGSLTLNHDTTNKYFSLVGSYQATLPGDFDGDGDVDGADFIVWQTNFPTATGADLNTGDADNDDDVDGADFAAWQGSFPVAPAPGTSPVPEPKSWLLVCVGLLGMLSIGLRGKRRDGVCPAIENSL